MGIACNGLGCGFDTYIAGEPQAVATAEPPLSPAPAAAPAAAQLSSAAGCAANEAKRDGDTVDARPPADLVVVAVGVVGGVSDRQAAVVGRVWRRVWAGVCSLSTPAEFPPQYGLDHDLKSAALISWTRWPARPASIRRRQLHHLLNNGERSIRPCSRRLSWPSIDHDRGLHLLGRRDRIAVRAALAAKAQPV